MIAVAANWDVELAQNIGAIASGGSGTAMMTARVQSVSPLQIMAQGVTLSRYLYIAPACREELRSGDTVVVMRDGLSFYILTKVVKA